MEESLKELLQITEELFPSVTYYTYVPPSNYLSEEGREAVKNTLPDLKVISRQQQLDNPANITDIIADTAMSIIRKSWKMRDPIRMLTITAINLCDENQAQQLSLFADENVLAEKGEKVERAMDDIRKKFGTDAIKFGSVIGNDIGLD